MMELNLIKRNKDSIIRFCPICYNIMFLNKGNPPFFKCRICGSIEYIEKDSKLLYQKEKLIVSHKEEDLDNLVNLRKFSNKNLKSELPNFKCSKCGSEYCIIIYSHKRCLSKPTNIFVKCQYCGKLTRINNY